jgi:hypothetical protein
MLERPPADIKELINSSFDTKPPLMLEFEEHERGNRSLPWRGDPESPTTPKAGIRPKTISYALS